MCLYKSLGAAPLRGRCEHRAGDEPARGRGAKRTSTPIVIETGGGDTPLPPNHVFLCRFTGLFFFIKK